MGREGGNNLSRGQLVIVRTLMNHHDHGMFRENHIIYELVLDEIIICPSAPEGSQVEHKGLQPSVDLFYGLTLIPHKEIHFLLEQSQSRSSNCFITFEGLLKAISNFLGGLEKSNGVTIVFGHSGVQHVVCSCIELVINGFPWSDIHWVLGVESIDHNPPQLS